MTQNALNQPQKGKISAKKPGDPRAPHSIRFLDSEWKLIQRAAALHGIRAGELVRNGAMTAAEELLEKPPKTTLSHGHAALIEDIYRMVYMMATLDRGRLLDAGRSAGCEFYGGMDEPGPDKPRSEPRVHLDPLPAIGFGRLRSVASILRHPGIVGSEIIIVPAPPS